MARAKASDRIRMGFIGVGNRGTQLLERFMANPKAEIVALCDVYEPYLKRDRSAVHPRYLDAGIPVPKMGEAFPSAVDRYHDFRDLLAREDIDAVCIATPDHWHAIQTIMAFRSGKDVFVEKPLTITPYEGRRMIEVERETGRIGAVCLNRRGSTVFRKLVSRVRDGAIGTVVMGCARRISSMFPEGIGNVVPENPPPDFDWDMWLGPRAAVPYRFNIAPYRFRWWADYSSQMGNWGVHYLDVIRWAMNEDAPVRVSAAGGNLVLRDDRTIPDTMVATFQFRSGALAQFEIIESAGGQGINGGEIELRGSKGVLFASQDRYRVVPASRGQFQTWDSLIEPEEYNIEGKQSFGDLGIKEDSTAILIDDFLDCVTTRKSPLCTLEDGHRSTLFAHLANIALVTGTQLEWDPEQETITNSEAANARCHYAYREPWTLE